MGNDDKEQGNTPENAGPGEAPPAPKQAEPLTLEQQIEQLEKLEKDKRDLHDRLLRTAAEFENFKKRTKKEAEEASTRGREQLLKELLPAIDNLERALKHAAPGDPLAVGVQQTEKLLLQALEKFGVVRFSSVGKPFDPSMHEAVATEPGSAGSTVVEVYQTGYRLGQSLLRPAMVKVAVRP